MSYTELLECKRSDCKGINVIPIKIVVKENRAVVISRCPNCHRKHKVVLNMLERKEWLPLVRRLFLSCEVCGQPLPPNWRYFGSGALITRGFQTGRTLRLTNPCYNCRKNDMKAISEFLWSEINPTPPPPPPTYAPPPPPQSEVTSVTTDKLFCTQCGTSISPGTKFCSACGAKI